MGDDRLPRAHLHPRNINNLKGLHQEVREARRAIDGAAGRKARKLRNRDAHRGVENDDAIGLQAPVDKEISDGEV